MATEPLRGPIKRVAMLVELESGETLVLFAQPDPDHNDAQIDVQMRQPDPQLFTAHPPEPAVVRWIVNGLHQYRMADAMPTMVNTYLDSIATAVDL